MDVVGALGYIGQDIRFIDGERFAFLTGNSFCIYDTTKGPREMVWKMESGVGCYTANLEIQCIAYAPASATVFGVELIYVADQSTRAVLENPTKTPVIDMCFSRDGDMLYALTDTTNHNLLVWSIGSQCRLLVCKGLGSVSSSCQCNPCNGNQICLYGSSGLVIGTVSEIMQNYSVKLEAVDTRSGSSQEDDNEGCSFVSSPAFVLWIPQNRILTADRDGHLFETRMEGSMTRKLGRFAVPDKRGNKMYIVPTGAVLSVSNLIVGTDQGQVYWYPLLNLMNQGSLDPIVELDLPVQSCNVHSRVTELTMDEHFLTLLIGTQAGAIFKVPVDVVESDFGKLEPDADIAGANEVGRAFRPVDTVAPVQLGNDAHFGGVILCASHLTIEVQKFSARSRSSLSMFLTGSHLGALQFWRYTSQVVENMTPMGGIRRSAPRALKTVFQLALGGAEAAAVCAMEMVALPLRHARLLVVGSEDGCVEVWTIEAQENEDEDARDSSSAEDKAGYSLRLLEDDEGSCLARLEARRIFQCKLFTSPVTFLCATPPSANEPLSLRIAAAADGEEHVYFLGAVKDDAITVHRGVEAFVVLPTGLSVRSMAWTEDFLHLFCSNGEVLLYQGTEGAPPQLMSRKGTGLSVVVDASLTASSASFVLLSNSTQMRIGPLRALQEDRSAAELRSYEHSDVVVHIAHAPNGRYFATGCLDGSLLIWRVDGDAEEVQEANRLKPHAAAVSSLAFSCDSSLLLSAAVDGSCFVFTLDKPSGKGPNRMGSVRASFMQEEGPQYLSDMLPESAITEKAEPPQGGSTWIEQRELEKAKDMRSRHKFKAMGIGAAVNEIGQRLRVLVSQNAERNELEVLDRHEFVIDVKRKEAVEVHNAELAASTRRLYTQRNFCNELRAARARTKCWDQLDVKATAILPLSPTPDGGLALGVSSFSVQKYSSDQLGNLNKLKRLRGMEVRTQRGDDQGSVNRISGTTYFRSAWATSLAGCPQTVSWISNDGTRWPISDKVTALLAADKATDASAGGHGAGKEKPTEATVEAEEDEGSVDEDDLVLEEENVLNLLYPPQAVRTQAQKRVQIALLREVIRQVRVKFNEHFEKLRKEKADIIASVESRNVRIHAILEDLHQHEDLFSPTVADKEVPDSAVVVIASELKTVPYESGANRLIRLREEEERRQRELARDKEDAKGRALEEMMHGTLEVRRDMFAEASAFVKPDWMDTLLPSEMNEAQVKEYDAYVAKLKALQEEQALYRKALEQEMKRLKNEVTELCKSFDEKLGELAALKVLVHREILSQEVYIARLALNMAKTEQTMKFLRKSEEQVQSLRGDRAELRRSMELLSTQLEDMKAKIGSIQEEERQMDKTFRRDLQNLCNNNFDQDALKVLTQLYRQRTYPRGGEVAAENFGDQSEADASASASKTHRRSRESSNRGGKNSKSQSKRGGGGGLNSSSTNDVNKNRKLRASKGGASAGGGGNGGKDGALGPMQQAAQALRTSDEPNYKEKDPYYEALLDLEKQKVQQEAQIPILVPQSIELDCPEGFDIDQYSWSKLQELRNARIEKEIEGKMLSIEFSKLKQKLERLDCEEGILAGCVGDIRSSREIAIAALHDLESNLDIVVRLRQGQDEVDRDAVVTDYSDALLLPITVLSKYNSRIKELGREKITVLSKIKLFRRKINLIDWEAKHHGMEARHYEAYLTDLQLFRVTRELQRVIRDGSDASQAKERVDKVSARIEYQTQDAEMKLLALKKNNEFFKRQLEDRQQECLALEEKISTLKAQDSLSRSVKQSRDEARGGTGGDPITMAANKMKKVVARRHMVDTARAQAEEIDYLRQELDKMRQRTFPSFVKATRKRLTAVNGDVA